MKFTRTIGLLASAIAVADFSHALPSSTHGSTHNHGHGHLNNVTAAFGDVDDLVLRRQADSSTPELRILALGASIVYGADESHKNGFRKYLRDQLRFKGYLVNMVGTKQGGDMVDRDVEANPGDTIDQVKAASRNSYPFKPNVVLINAGTNDANQNLQVGAGQRMESMIKDMWAADGMSDTLMIVSSVLQRSDASAERNRKDINEQLIPLVTRLRAEGRPIRYVDMPLNMPADFKGDGIHPNDNGFKIMAKSFWIAIEYARRDGLIKQAAPFTGVVTNTCEKVAGQATYGGITQKGSGNGDGIYYHNSVSKGSIWSYTSDFDRDQWFFARLYGQKYDDLLGWWITDGVVTYATWKNIGGGQFARVSDTSTGLFCNPKGVFWVDLNADGYDDFLCVAPSGDTQASINNRDGTDAKPPTFTFIGVIKTNEGYAQDRVRWGDIDGDGRADYCVVDDGGNILVWRNSGTTDKPAFWQSLGLRFTAKGMGDMNGVRFDDINGDGRDDWLWVGENGATTTWTNSRSCQPGVDGNGLNVAWRQGFWKGATSGPTHAGVGGTSNRNRIHFARIYSTDIVFGNLARADYVFMDVVKQADGRFKFDMKVWQNTGGGSTKLEADGNKYCNMHGHADNRMDYVWTWSTGKMTVWPNLGKKSVSGDEVFWNSPKDLWDSATFLNGRQLDRRDLHLADWNNDGACDIVWTDPDNSNRVKVWLNQYKTTGSFANWTPLDNPAPELSCAERRGLGIHDLPVRFADISGNGLSDYLCIEPDGRISGWVHETNGAWTRINQFKKAEGIDRANIRFGNVDGAGGQDLIWVDKFSGDATVYTNNGKLDTGGSNWWFLKKGKQYDGNWAGTCQYFPDLDGDGRADLHSIMGTFTNRAETFFNRCGLYDLRGDDAGWAPGQDPGFGPLPNEPVSPEIDPLPPGATKIRDGADPSVMSIGNTWYSVEAAEAGGIYVREASSIVGLGTESAQRTKVWTDTGLGEVWAPEIMAENGKTYIYFAAGVKQAHRMYVISADSPRGTYSQAQKLDLPGDRWAIDGIYFRFNDQGWFAWSGWEGDSDGEQSIFICQMESPTQPVGDRYIISQPREGWERNNGSPYVNEGPQVIVDPNGQLHIVYSVNHSWQDEYCLADLRLRKGGDPTYVWDWYKSNGCVFGSHQDTLMTGWDATLYNDGPGHHTFALPSGDVNQSPGGTSRYVFVYHGVKKGTEYSWEARSWYTGSYAFWGETTYSRKDVPGATSDTGFSFKFFE